jgi:hypothetical protein
MRISQNGDTCYRPKQANHAAAMLLWRVGERETEKRRAELTRMSRPSTVDLHAAPRVEFPITVVRRIVHLPFYYQGSCVIAAPIKGECGRFLPATLASMILRFLKWTADVESPLAGQACHGCNKGRRNTYKSFPSY